MSQEQPPVAETATIEPKTAPKSEPAPVVESKQPEPASTAAADLKALIDAAVATSTAPFVEQAQLVAFANAKQISLPAAQKVAELRKLHPSLTQEQALALAKVESPNDFAIGYRPHLHGLLPVGADSALRDKRATEKSYESKYDEAIDFANNGANGSRAAGKAVTRERLGEALQVMVARKQGALA